MRRPLDVERLRQVLDALGRACRGPGVLYLTGGATALLEGWRNESRFVGRFGQIEVRHYDFRAQALSKLARGFGRDLSDVRAMRDRGLVTCDGLRSALDEMTPRLERFPRVDRRVLLHRLEELCGSAGGQR